VESLTDFQFYGGVVVIGVQVILALYKMISAYLEKNGAYKDNESSDDR